jgi:hypothetical protein
MDSRGIFSRRSFVSLCEDGSSATRRMTPGPLPPFFPLFTIQALTPNFFSAEFKLTVTLFFAFDIEFL